MLEPVRHRIEVVRIRPHTIETWTEADDVSRWRMRFTDAEVRRDAYPSEVAAANDRRRRERG